MDRHTSAAPRDRRGAGVRRLWRYLAGSRTPSADPGGDAGAVPPGTRPRVPAPRLERLEPEKTSGLLGRWAYDDSLDSAASILRRIKPRSRFVLIGLAVAILFLILASFGHCLTNPNGVRTTIGLILNPGPAPAVISLPLLQDPVGIVAIAMTLLTPVLFAEQVSAIQVFNQTNERNIAYRVLSLDCAHINDEVRRVNKHFSAIGGRGSSTGFLAASAVFSSAIIYLINKWGLFPSWNKTDLTAEVWRRRVYAGWWANPHSHLPLAIVLWLLGCYFFYFVLKQVTMGAFFAVYIKRISHLRFGVSPNMSANTDGFWGLRPMRRFMVATYSSTVCHTAIVLGILVVWLPFNAFTVFILAMTITINALVVIYPSVVGSAGARDEKMRFAEHHLADAQTPTDAEATLVDQIWSRPNLPFRARSALTAVMIYLVFPLLLAIGAQLLGHP